MVKNTKETDVSPTGENKIERRKENKWQKNGERHQTNACNTSQQPCWKVPLYTIALAVRTSVHATLVKSSLERIARLPSSSTSGRIKAIQTFWTWPKDLQTQATNTNNETKQQHFRLTSLARAQDAWLTCCCSFLRVQKHREKYRHG